MLCSHSPRSQSRLETPREFGSNREGKGFSCILATDAGHSVSFGHSKEKRGCGGPPGLCLKTREQARLEETEDSVLTESIPGKNKNQDNEKSQLPMCNNAAGTNTCISNHKYYRVNI